MIRNKIKEILKKLKIFNFLKRVRDKFDKRHRALKISGDLCLEKLKLSFDSIGVQFWLVYGTLLGAVREGDFIGHDLDIDIGAFNEDNKKEIQLALIENGFFKFKEFILEGRVVEETYIFKDISIDIFYYDLVDNKMIDYSFKKDVFENIKTEKVGDTVVESGLEGYRQIATYTGFKKIQFKGMLFSVPKDINKYLVENYGEDYMIVKKEWDVPNIERISATDIISVRY